MKSNINDLPLRTYSSLPKSWPARPNLMNYDKADPSIHYADGWRDFIQPEYNIETQRLGALIYDDQNDVVTREVIEKTAEELAQEVLSQAQGSREEAINTRMRVKVEEEAQAITDDAEAIEAQAVYPIWDDIEDGFEFTNDFKVQALDGLELKLFKTIQPHAKQFDRHPNETPALWSKIEIGEGGVEIWTQPTGGDGKYPLNDPATGTNYVVTHNGKTWRNIYQNGLNVWIPGEFGWEEII